MKCEYIKVAKELLISFSERQPAIFFYVEADLCFNSVCLVGLSRENGWKTQMIDAENA